LLLVLGAILLTRMADWLREKIIAHIDAGARETDELVRSEASKHRQVIAQVVTWGAVAVIYVVAGYRATGGKLPENWRRMSLLVDLFNWADFLNRPHATAVMIDDAKALFQRTMATA
jgi:hypothetical protein